MDDGGNYIKNVKSCKTASFVQHRLYKIKNINGLQFMMYLKYQINGHAHILSEHVGNINMFKKMISQNF